MAAMPPVLAEAAAAALLALGAQPPVLADAAAAALLAPGALPPVWTGHGTWGTKHVHLKRETSVSGESPRTPPGPAPAGQ